MSAPSPGEAHTTNTIQELLGSRRVLTVSNREPYIRKTTPQGTIEYEIRAGGLVTALTPVMRSCGGVWIAWEPENEPRREQVPGEGPCFTLRQVPLTKDDVEQYYQGFANRALWPLCHYFVDRCYFDERQWAAYHDVNQRFAEAVVDEEGEEDLIWIHDYHFCLAPKMIRERSRNDNPVAFFLHIPFPSQQVYRILPWRREVLMGMLGADFIGFHTPSYVKNFLDSCHQILGADIDHASGRVRWEGRNIDVSPYPIGIDTPSFESVAESDDVAEAVPRLRSHVGVEKIVLGVDRLDYSKGILERLYAVERLFDDYPHFRRKVTFIQVAVPSRTNVTEYERLKRSVDETVGRINGKHSDARWAPIIYIYRGLPRTELISYFKAADVALVTPLRDGMNLVAKEYVASHTDDDGVLILSEFAGAGDEMKDGAVLVNPYSVRDVVTALEWALTMSPEERSRRMKLMRDVVRRHDINYWLTSIVARTLETSSLSESAAGELA